MFQKEQKERRRITNATCNHMNKLFNFEAEFINILANSPGFRAWLAS